MLPHLPDIGNKNQRCATIHNDKKCQYSSGTLTSEKSLYMKKRDIPILEYQMDIQNEQTNKSSDKS